MRVFTKGYLIGSLMLPCLLAAEVEKEQHEVSSIGGMFEHAKVSGDIRTIYSVYDLKKTGEADTYATAVGGSIKYELAEYEGFGGAVAFRTSHDIGALSGDGTKRNTELSSSASNYDVLSEAYIDYSFEGFALRAGRQSIDTPLADSDDIRMVPNTFEAYILTYELEKTSFLAGHIKKWQGYDAGLEEGWVKTGDNGTNMLSVIYTDDMFEASAWYYDITKMIGALYLDASLKYELNSDVTLGASLQYLHEREKSASGVEAEIYGAMLEASAYGIDVAVAYNRSEKKKRTRPASAVLEAELSLAAWRS